MGAARNADARDAQRHFVSLHRLADLATAGSRVLRHTPLWLHRGATFGSSCPCRQFDCDACSLPRHQIILGYASRWQSTMGKNGASLSQGSIAAMTAKRATSRPLRALWLAVGLWIAGRSTAVLYLWPSVKPQATALVAVSGDHRVRIGQSLAQYTSLLSPPGALTRSTIVSAIPRRIASGSIALELPMAMPDLDAGEPSEKPESIEEMTAPIFAGSRAFTPAQLRTPIAAGGSVVPLTPSPPASTRWSVSTYLLARSGGSTSLASAGQLGGSQAGARADFALNHNFFSYQPCKRTFEFACRARSHARGGITTRCPWPHCRTTRSDRRTGQESTLRDGLRRVFGSQASRRFPPRRLWTGGSGCA